MCLQNSVQASRCQGNASAAHRFRNDKPESSLDAGQNEDRSTHQVGHVGPVAEDADTGMR